MSDTRPSGNIITADFTGPWTPAASAQRREAAPLLELRNRLWEMHVEDEVRAFEANQAVPR